MIKRKNKLFYFSSFFIYLFLTVIFFIFSISVIEQYARSFYTSVFASSKPQSDKIVEIVIDDYTVQKFKWPWTRDMYTDLFDYFSTYAYPKTIAMDSISLSFNENPTPAELRYINKVSLMKNLVLGFLPESVSQSAIDNKLLDGIDKFSIDAEIRTEFEDSPYNSLLIQSELVKKASHNYGSVNIATSGQEGIIFESIPIVKINNNYYPSLAFKSYLLANSTNKIIIDDDFIIIPKTGLKIPYFYSNGNFSSLIRYYKPIANDYSHISISAYKILETYKALKSGITPKNHPELFSKNADKYINPEFFKDKYVFIGANISGPSADVLKTPMTVRHPGVDIQATVFDNLMNNNILVPKFGFAFIWLFLLSLIAFIIIMRASFFKGLLLILLVDFLYLSYVCFSASNGSILYFATTPVICQIVTAIFAYSFKFLNENRNKEKIKQAMGKYISQDVMKNVVKDIDNLGLGGKRAIVTVLFSDIRGFTSLSEKMSAEEVSMILNEYFSEMEPIITKYNGVINKFIGDAVMAIFGEPIRDENHARNAVKCAYEMLKKVEYLREKWLLEGKPKIEIGVGINTGEVFIGNIGTETRMEYTVIGDTVNLASRIEGYNKVYKTNLLVSSSTYENIADMADVIKIKEVQIRGKSKKMDIYEILRI